MRAHLRRCLYTVDSLKRLTHTVTHTRKRADGSSGNRDVEEYFNSSENDQKRPENDIFRIFLLFVISRSGVRVRLPAPILSANSELNMGGIPEWPKGADCKSVVSDFGGSNPPSPTKLRIERCGVLLFSRRFPNYFMSFCGNGTGSRTTIFGRKPVLFFAFPASSDRVSWSELSGLLSFSERH